MIKWNPTQKYQEFHNSTQMETWRQRLHHEDRDTKKTTAMKIKELEAELKEKNTYMHHF